jgi:hypothetical protein
MNIFTFIQILIIHLKKNFKMNSNQFYEPDLELAEALNSLFFEIILPSLIIIGYVATKREVKAVIVNNFEYRFLEEPKKKDKTQER